MKVLFLHRWVGLREGGTETEVKLLASYLADRGHQVTVLTLPGKSAGDLSPKIKKYFVWKIPGESDYSYNIHDPRLYFYTLGFMFQSLAWLLVSYFILGRRFDFISVHFYTEGVVARIFKRLTGTSYVFVLEGYTRLEAGEALLADKAFCISRYDQDRCFEDFGYRPNLKPIGIDTGRWSEARRDPELRRRYAADDETLCLTVCRLEPRKDLPTLINAARIVNQAAPSIKFLIVGEGICLLALKRMVKDYNLDKSVMFAGRVSEADLVRYYQIGDIFVLPTLYEGFGIVYLEAMVSGLPIISTRVGAVPEVVADCGVLIEPKNPELLAKAITDLTHNPEQKDNLRKKGLNRVKAEYNREKIMSFYEEECVKVTENK